MNDIDRRIESLLTSIEADRARILEEREADRARAKEEKEKDERRWKKLDEIIKNINREIGGISNSNGDFAEEYFENVFLEELTFAGMQFHEMITRKKFDNRIRHDEFDIILLNEKNVLIVETKYKAHEDDINELIEKADAFRFWYPEHKDQKVFLGLASLRFEDNIIGKAKKKGIAVIRQLGDKTVVNDENLKAY